jgi:isopenicillin-N N-acyltransferase-like protein
MQAKVIELAGTPRRMGRQFGEQLREQTRQFADVRLECCVQAAKKAGLAADKALVLETCGRCVDAHQRYDAAVWDELHGIAEGAGLSDEMILICNGLTDIRDAVGAAAGAIWASAPAGQAGLTDARPGRPAEEGGCTAWMAAAEATEAERVLAGQTWDMHAAAREFIVVVRRTPESGPATLSMTTAGCLSLVGVNSAGIAVGNNNLRPIDARPGVMYLAMIHRALSQSTLGGAVNAITQAHRCSGHNYYLAGSEGEIVDIETTAGQFEVIQPAGAVYAHTNHYLADRLRAFEQPGAVSESSTWRLTRMLHVLSEQAGQITPASMMQAMSDTQGTGACRIWRNDPADAFPTCGAAVLSPQQRRMWVAAGEPKPETFVEFGL